MPQLRMVHLAAMLAAAESTASCRMRHRVHSDALLHRQGYWSACYGPHGLEIVHLRLAAGHEPGAEHCPCAASPRLIVHKVLYFVGGASVRRARLLQGAAGLSHVPEPDA